MGEKYEHEWRKRHAYGVGLCECERTGPERTWNNSVDCPWHSPDAAADDDRPTPNPPLRVVDMYRPPPSHYAGKGGIDPWAFIAAHGLDYWQGNVIKYVTRAGKKEIATKLEDLLKARDFLNYMIEREQRNEEF